MEHNLFQTTKSAFINLAKMEATISEEDIKTMQHAINKAYDSASPTERKELEEMQRQLQDNDYLY